MSDSFFAAAGINCRGRCFLGDNVMAVLQNVDVGVFAVSNDESNSNPDAGADD